MKGFAFYAVIFCFCLAAAGGQLFAQNKIKRQVFAGSGISAPWAGGSCSISAVGGFALIIPMTDRLILKPAVSGGSVSSLKTGESYPSAAATCAIGYRIARRFMVLSGEVSPFHFPMVHRTQRCQR